MNCKNCGDTVTGKFCSNCGQKADVHQITVKHVLHDLVHAFTHTDKGFLLLIKKLITKPGFVAREYITGQRKKYFNPLSFLVISAAIHFFLTYKTGYFMSQGGGNRRMPAIWIEAFEISNSNNKLLDLFLLIPLITILGWIFFRKPKYNIAEHFVLQAFVLGQGLIIRVVIFIPLFLMVPQLGRWHVMLFQITFLVYLIHAYRQFFQQHIAWTILKSVLLMVLYILLYWGLILAYVYIKNLLF